MNDKVWKYIAIGLVVVIGLGVGGFFGLIYIDGYITDKQIQAQEAVIITITQSISQQGYVEITRGNQSMFLAPFDPRELQGNL